MALADRWLLPDGVNEMLPPLAGQVEAMRRRILDLYDSWGYDLVMPPLVEHLESLMTGVGKDLDLNTFKVTDQVSGHLLGIRADITPQVARIDAHRLRTDGPSRLGYCGSVLHTRPANMLASRNPLQIGAELYGHSGSDSDLEVISLMLESLLVAGIKTPITLDLGHVGIVRSLLKSAGLSEAQEAEYLDLLENKAMPEIQVFVEGLEADGAVCELLAQLPRLNGQRDVLQKAKNLFEDTSARSAVEYLELIADQVSARYPQVEIYFDLSELRGYAYHTGIVFAAFTPSYGQAIAKGGRYDEIGRDFGRARPATGFSSDLKTLVELSAAIGQEQSELILAPAEADAELQARIRELRASGKRVVQQLSGESPDGQAAMCQLVKQDGQWVVVTC